MLLEQLTDEGRKKVIERRMAVRCLICNEGFVCPADVEEWSWLKSDAVETFKTEHAMHGSARTVGAQVTFFEKE